VVSNTLKPSNFKEWLWSAKVLTTIVWILFPLGYITAVVITYELPVPTEVAIFLGPDMYVVPSEVSDVSCIYLVCNNFIFMPSIPFMVVLFLFSIFPARYHTESFFRKRGSENAVLEYQYIRKILFVFLIASVILIIIYYFIVYIVAEQLSNPIYGGVFDRTLGGLGPLSHHMYFVQVALLVVSFFILLKLLLEHARKQFRFYYAKACFEIINKKKSETDKAEYLHLGLDWYNKFVKRVTKSEIDVETIYSRIVSSPQLSNNILLDYYGVISW
jgi:hypothetical protein